MQINALLQSLIAHVEQTDLGGYNLPLLLQHRQQVHPANVELRRWGDKPEFDSWRWSSLDDLPHQIVPFKRQLYTDLTAEFRDSIQRNIRERA